MTSRGQVWKCNVCGNIIGVLHEGADSLVCCDQPMVLMEAKNSDPEVGEKHLPVIEVDGEGVVVKVGSVPHPMEEKHYIEWIEVSTAHGNSKKFLKPGDEPVAKFPVKIPVSEIKARAYCNVHGLWSN